MDGRIVISDIDCGGIECENGHKISFHKESHRFCCVEEGAVIVGCNATMTTGIFCPGCNSDTIRSDESGRFCTSAFCYCSDDYDLCLENRIGAFKVGLELCDGNPWELDLDWVIASWKEALNRGMVTEDEHKEGLREAEDYFGRHH